MSKRGIRVSQEGLEKAKKVLMLRGLTQQALAKGGGYSRATVSKFFNGKLVEKSIFSSICSQLNLQVNDIAELEVEIEKAPQVSEIEEIVQDIRQKIQADIQQSCGTMRVLDMTQPIELGSIYTQVNILEKITGRRRIDLEKFSEDLNSENFDRFGWNKVKEKPVEGLKAVLDYSKLMVLGKPGAGKTTFLKYLTIQCIQGNFLKYCIPVFIPLKQFAEIEGEPGLLDYICQWLGECGVSEAETKAQQILKKGRALVLLDGLDEVREEDSDRIIKEIRQFSQQFSLSQFVITCRIAASDYTFDQFTEVEVADFEDEQIKKFAKSWFEIKNLDYAEDFIQQLEDNPQIKELATSPLLLTLLCLEFEDSRSFPADRAELYKRATETLLRKWDDKRQIQRQQVYKQLSVKRKEDLLSQVAFSTFKEKHYFFKQRIVENHIADYISNLPDAPTETEKLHLDSGAVLKSIEAQHGLLVERARGIYSFSHLTFQEYFTAQKIVSEQAIPELVEHITEKRWREVFLLTPGMLSNAGELLKLMKQRVDGLLAADEKLQKFLTWVNRKVSSVETSYKPAAIRIFYICLSRYLSRYLSLYLSRYLSLSLSRDLTLNLSRYLRRDLSRDLTGVLSRDLSLYLSRDLTGVLSRDLSLYLSQVLALDISPELKQTLQNLITQLPKEDSEPKVIKQWWLENSESWAQQLRNVMIEHCYIGYDWQFTQDQKKSLGQYLNANKLLLDCLENGYVTRAVREEIESTLYLPVEQLEN
ncbi:NACHT domain-containing protein [Calothrix rhizosoleniae]|uniref:NACHT domain-containing protein n=1 Tax=Calothrix rhizosoleniae TaxID=888997 RepID=UPI000B4A3448|nr:NACHT domain-containing NTPase [Calothrix rhizosoleniae]